MTSVRVWERVTYREKCGRCGGLLAAGDPMLTIQFERMRRKLIRCASCEGPAPPDLPERQEHFTVAEMARIKSAALAMTPIADFSIRTALPRLMVDNNPPREWLPYREPGDDDD